MITYKKNAKISIGQLKDLYENSNTGARRPVHDNKRLKALLHHSNLIYSAWHGKKLVGICRCMTDIGYVIYIVDMAVHDTYQGQGIGKQLIDRVRKKAAGKLRVILVSTKEAHSFYEKMGFEHHPRAWIIPGTPF